MKIPAKPKVIIRSCREYDAEKIRQIIRAGLDELGLRPFGRTLVKPNLVAAGPLIAGPESADFIVEQFRKAPASLQEHLLTHSLRRIRALALERAVGEIAGSTDDVDLRNAAEAFLEASAGS